MASKSHTLLILVPFLLLVSSAVAFDIAKILEDYTEYSTFLKYLAETKLSEEIDKRPAVSVLVVDDSAISPLSSLSGDALKKAVGMHILLDYYDPYELDRLHTKATTLNSISGPVAYTQPGKETMMFGNPGVELIKVVAARPYNLSVLQVTGVITDAKSGSTTPAASTSTHSDTPAPAATETHVEAPKASTPAAPATEAPKTSAAASTTAEAPHTSSTPSSTTEAPKASIPSTGEANEKSPAPAETHKTDAATPSSAPNASNASTSSAEAPKKSATTSTPAEAPETKPTTANTVEAPASGGEKPAEGPEGSVVSPVAGEPSMSTSSSPMPGVADAPAPGTGDAEKPKSGAGRAVVTATTTLGLAMGAALVLVAP